MWHLLLQFHCMMQVCQKLLQVCPMSMSCTLMLSVACLRCITATLQRLDLHCTYIKTNYVGRMTYLQDLSLQDLSLQALSPQDLRS